MAAPVPRPKTTAWLRLDTTTTVLLLYDYNTGAACLGLARRHGGARASTYDYCVAAIGHYDMQTTCARARRHAGRLQGAVRRLISGGLCGTC
ncbi:hypothetical protein F441_10661 [Phytophthora nicotianae CJ01A1]|uniref:Uncharacterized protein n=1 Tax=Phytophthora nicotianae CJ01A1 TaxID=1317063 RepID=W2WV26_PHYNI|nr:hypothetical protein F441_10661 [Phytophthora nicotianae CJ01A1]